MGKDITPQLNFVYSMNLRNSNDQIWIANYDITRRFSARGLRQNDSSYRSFSTTSVWADWRLKTYGFQYSRKIAHPIFGQHPLDGKHLSAAGLKPGSYDFFSAQRGRGGLEKAFAEEDRLRRRSQSTGSWKILWSISRFIKGRTHRSTCVHVDVQRPERSGP
jgi:hypothetical protein